MKLFTTIMLDESTDESNRSEMSLIVRILRNSKIENHFSDLVHLRRCDAETIFSEVETYFKSAGMDACSTMAWMIVPPWHV